MMEKIELLVLLVMDFLLAMEFIIQIIMVQIGQEVLMELVHYQDIFCQYLYLVQ
jgi:hypothetical protein